MFKRRVQELLFENNINQKKLAEKIGLTPATLSRNMNGLNSTKIEVIISIAKFFNVSTDYLLGISKIRNLNQETIEPKYTSTLLQSNQLMYKQSMLNNVKENRLKILRKENNLTVRELGEKINISYAAISKMENNQQNISNEYLIILSNFFKVSVEYLLGISNIKNSKQEFEPILFSIYNEIKDLNNTQKEDLLNVIKLITKNIKK